MKMHRPETRLERGEYLARTREYCLRGEQLPQSKLTDADIEDIRSAARQRESLRAHIKNNLTNANSDINAHVLLHLGGLLVIK